MENTELSIDNIITGDEMDDLFTSNSPDDVNATEKDDDVLKDKDDLTATNTKETVEETVDPNDLFTSESVNSGDDNTKDGKVSTSAQASGTSPDSTDFYSSIATACKEEGIFPDLEDDTLTSIKTADDFKEAMNKQVQAMLDDRQKRINEALEYGVETDDVKKYEQALSYLESLKDDDVKDESDKGVNLRRTLLFNDYLNRGFSQERAQKYTQRSFDQGTDVEDALEAKNSNKDFYNTQYSKLIDEAKAQSEEGIAEENRRAESIKKSILETEEPFEGIKIDKITRQKIFDLITKPVYKDKDGSVYTALQKAQRDDEEGFIKKLGYIYTLTDGFKNLDSLVKTKVQKETKRGFQKIEQALRTPSYTGEPKFASGVSGDEDAGSKGLVLDI